MSLIPVASKRQPVIILGMSRSGTTLIASTLERLGLFIGSDLQRDHESKYFLRLNDKIFLRVHGAWDNPLPVRNFLALPEAVDMTAQALARDVTSWRAARYLGASRFATHRSITTLENPWGWKDPRTTFTLPIWLKLFPQARIIYIVRNGVDVAASLLARERKIFKRRQARGSHTFNWPSTKSYLERFGFKGSARCLTLDGGFALWEEYLVQTEEMFKTITNPVLSLQFEKFLENPEKHLQEMADFCELKGVGSAEIEKAVQVDRTRAGAYAADPMLSAFHDKVKLKPLMVQNGY